MLDLTFAGWDLTVDQWLVALMILLDLIVAGWAAYGILRYGSRPDAEQFSGIAVIAAVIGATEFTLVRIAVDTIPSWVRVVSSLTAFAVAIFCASKNCRRPSLRGTLVLAIGLIGFLVLSIGRSTLKPTGSCWLRLPSASGGLLSGEVHSNFRVRSPWNSPSPSRRGHRRRTAISKPRIAGELMS